MKLVNCRISTILSSICSSLLALLGFSSCSNNELMYGTPFGSFEMKGSVTDDSGKPISEAEIRVTYTDMPSGVFSIGSIHTEHNGTYALKENEWASSLKVVCIPHQTDLQPDSVIVDMNYKGADGEWYKGHAEEIVDFKLKAINTEE